MVIGYDVKTGKSIPYVTGSASVKSGSYITKSSEGDTVLVKEQEITPASAGGYFIGGYTDSGEPLVGYASQEVSRVSLGARSSGGTSIYDRGSSGVGTGESLRPGVQVTPRERGMPYEVSISPALYNKYAGDIYGRNAPYRRAEASDTVIATSQRGKAIYEYETGGRVVYPGDTVYGDFNRFAISSQDVIPVIVAREQALSKFEKGTVTQGLNIGAGFFEERGRELRATNTLQGDVYGAGAEFTGKLLRVPSNWSRDLLISSGAGLTSDERGLFSTKERIGAGVNTGIRIVTLGYGFVAGSSAPGSVAIARTNKVLGVAGAVGLGAFGLDLATTKPSMRRSKALEFGAEVTALGLVGGVGYKIGRELNVYPKLSPDYVVYSRGGSGIRSVNRIQYGDIKYSSSGLSPEFLQPYRPKTFYQIGFKPQTYTIGRGSGTGTSYKSFQLGEGKTYFIGEYKGVFNNYYARGVTSRGGETSIKYFKGDKLVSTVKGRYPGITTLESDLSLTSKRLKIGSDKTTELSTAFRSSRIIGKDYQGMSYDVVRSDLTIKTVGGKGIKKASQFDIINALDWSQSGTNIKAYGGLKTTKYIPVSYIPKNEVLTVQNIGFGFRVEKPATTRLTQDISFKGALIIGKKGVPKGLDLQGGGLSAIKPPEKIGVYRSVFKPVNQLNIPKKTYYPGLVSVGRQESFMFIPTLNLKSNVKTRGESKFSFEPSFKLVSRPSVGLVNDVVVRTAYKNSLVSKPQSVLDTSLKVSTITSTTFFTPGTAITTPPPPPDINPPPPSPFYLPRGLGFGGSRGLSLKPGKNIFNPQYVATVEAGIRGIRGRKPSENIISSGLTLRPLVRI